MRCSAATSASMSSQRVVEGERGPHRALEAEAAQDRLRAVVARADGDALAIERAADLLGRGRRRARTTARPPCRAPCRSGAGPGPRASCSVRVVEQLVLVARDVLDAERAAA